MSGHQDQDLRPRRENWASKFGVIMVVAGSAVGLGNFLRFPGQAAGNGGGIFMIPYFISLLLVGLPLVWAEWTMGRFGGARGFNSSPAIFNLLWRHPASKYFGVLAMIIPVVIYMYYVYIEVWCLRYAIDYATGAIAQVGAGAGAEGSVAAYSNYFKSLVGMTENGWPSKEMLGLVVLTFMLNFFLIYRGVNKGIEWFSKFAMPALIVIAAIVVVRVLTLGTPDPSMPERNILNGLGFMWNPRLAEGTSLLSSLANPQMWLAAASQVFFSLSIGYGIILNYASYVRPDDDIALSGLTSAATNELCEVVLAGLMIVPAIYLFLNLTDVDFGSTLSLGFHALPSVFERMPLGNLFGMLFFLMLFIAAITSSLSMLQPAIAFLEEGFALGRRASVTFLAMIVTIGALIVIHFSENLVALDTMDFWVATLLLFILAMVHVILFGWVFDVRLARAELTRGAEIPIPRLYWFVIKYISPVYLVAIFVGFCWYNLPDRIRGIIESNQRETILFVLAFVGLLMIGFTFLIKEAGRRWERRLELETQEDTIP